MNAMAEQRAFEFIDLDAVQIPNAVIDLIPESVARDNVVIPLGHNNGVLKIVSGDPDDFSLVDKLRFILNQEIELAISSRGSIAHAINRHYGQS